MDNMLLENAADCLQDGELTERQVQIVCLIAAGYSDKEIAQRLAISERTAKGHLRKILEKVGACDRFELTLVALHRGLLRQTLLLASREGSCC